MVHATDPAVVYIHRSDTEVLYVGVTNDYGRRTKQHVDNPKAAWWPEVTSTTVHRYSMRMIALAVEATLIKELRPRHNIQHAVPRPVPEPPPLPPFKPSWAPPQVTDMGMFDEMDVEHLEVLSDPVKRFQASYGYGGDGGLEYVEPEQKVCLDWEHIWERDDYDGWFCGVCGVETDPETVQVIHDLHADDMRFHNWLTGLRGDEPIFPAMS